MQVNSQTTRLSDKPSDSEDEIMEIENVSSMEEVIGKAQQIYDRVQELFEIVMELTEPNMQHKNKFDETELKSKQNILKNAKKEIEEIQAHQLPHVMTLYFECIWKQNIRFADTSDCKMFLDLKERINLSVNRFKLAMKNSGIR